MNSNAKSSLRIARQKELGLPFYTLSEEIANAITHGFGVIFAILSAIFLIYSSPKNFCSLFCVCVYETTIFILYNISTLYHALGICKAKKVFRVLDHCSIFLSIAGTYTPICFFKMGLIGKIMLFIIWFIAIIGIILNSVDLKKHAKISLLCYMFMGWAIIFTIKPLMNSISTYQFRLLLFGGVSYSIGVLFYLFGKKIKYFHSLWHIFVLLGSILHFLMIYNFFTT